MAQRVLGGRYIVQDKIGTGGMAIVWRGLDKVLGRTVAIKTMLPQYAADPSFAARFKQEAQAAAALQSPYIVSVYDWGKDANTYYIVMEYLRGTDLKSGIRKHGALSPRKVAQIGSQIAQALSIAHKHDIIHRDIKPQNIMVQPDGNIKVMDFGIARAKNSHLTTDNSVLGTAHYVSPEQTQGKELGPTSDIYSLGIVMYEAATGKVPFQGDDAITVALKQVQEQPVPPSEINPKVDPALEAIILKCMQKDPAARFQSARELNRTLKNYLTGRYDAVAEATNLMTRVVPQPGIRPGSETRTMQNTQQPQDDQVNSTSKIPKTNVAPDADRKDTKRKKKMVLGVIAAIISLGIIGFVFWNILNAPSAKTVPNLSGLTQDQAIQQIEKTDYFQVGDINEEYSDTVEEGKVIDQDPAANSTATKGTKINLTISKGKEPAKSVQVPNLVNMTPQEAEAALKKVGLKFSVGDSVYSDKVESGNVAEQSPAPGSKVQEGDVVTYQLSKGRQSINASNWTGQSADKAKQSLESSGFNVTINEVYSASVPKGVVISQTPTGNQSKGITITLTVSKGPEPTTVPDDKDKSDQNDPDTGQGDNNQSSQGGNHR